MSDAVSPSSARRQGLIACHTCGLLSRPPVRAGRVRCPRCDGPLHTRTPRSLSRSWAFLAAAIVLYVPANLLPIMHLTSFGQTQSDTILSGVVYLLLHDMWPLALIVFIETLDTVIVYLSNTLSFLRVSAFSLNHAALAIAIFTLADMLGAFGTVITLVLGNLFILVLEGGIVMIQVMRLQYYEGFSRYFSGDGHEFAPLRLRRGPAEPS